jgi:hypothetical protein
MRSVLRLLVLCAAVSAAGCVSTIGLEDSGEYAPLLATIDARVGKVYSSDARVERVAGVLVRADTGKISIDRFNAAFDAQFRDTEELPLWPPWRKSDLSRLDAIVELVSVDSEIELGDEVGRVDTVTIGYRVCMYESSLDEIGCWDTRSSQSNPRNPLDCPLDVGRCILPMLEAAMDGAIAEMLVLMEKDRAVRAWAARTAQRATCRRGAGCIGLLWWPSNPSFSGFEFGQDIERCLVSRIRDELPGFTLLDRQRVQSMLFPLMELSTQPETEDEFARLLQREDVRRRLASQGIDYLVAYSGNTRQDDWQGGIFCGGGYGGGGCLGFMWSDKTTTLDAVLWDLADNASPRHAAAVDQGTSMIPAPGIPVPLPASTQNDACRELGRQIGASIRGE